MLGWNKGVLITIVFLIKNGFTSTIGAEMHTALSIPKGEL